MEESRFRREKKILQEIIQDAVDKLEGADRKDVVKNVVISWIAEGSCDDDSFPDEGYTKKQLWELFNL